MSDVRSFVRLAELERAGDELARVVEELGHSWRSGYPCPLCAALASWAHLRGRPWWGPPGAWPARPVDEHR